MNRGELEKMLRRLAYLAGVFVILSVIISAVEYKSTSFVNQVRVNIAPLADGQAFFTDLDVQTAIERSFGNVLEGLQLSEVDMDRVERVVEDIPYVKDADVFVDASNDIHIRIDQRIPMLRVMDRHGKQYYFDTERNVMPLSNTYTPRVLVATGNLPAYMKDVFDRENHPVKDVYFLAEKLLNDPFFKAMIEQIHFGENGFELVPKIGNQQIFLGSMTDLDEKLEKLTTFYAEAMPYEGWRKYKTIDLRFENQVVCKKR